MRLGRVAQLSIIPMSFLTGRSQVCKVNGHLSVLLIKATQREANSKKGRRRSPPGRLQCRYYNRGQAWRWLVLSFMFIELPYVHRCHWLVCFIFCKVFSVLFIYFSASVKVKQLTYSCLCCTILRLSSIWIELNVLLQAVMIFQLGYLETLLTNWVIMSHLQSLTGYFVSLPV